MMRQYAELKAAHPGTLLLFRCGDFYETYAEDAEDAGRVLGIIVTRKALGADGEVAMAGVPFHAIDGYLARLVRAGRRVAIAEQMEDPRQAKGIVKRDVVRVVTPGTAHDEGLVEERANNYLVALNPAGKGRWGIGLADLGTGYFALSEVKAGDLDSGEGSELLAELVRLEPRELLVPESFELAPIRAVLAERPLTITRRSADDFRPESARRLLEDHFRVRSLEGFGADGLDAGVGAAGALMRYLRETQKSLLPHLVSLRVRHAGASMVLDATTQRSLELVRNLHSGGREATLLAVLDHTATPMGGRLLRNWVLEPLRDPAQIESRLDAVGALVTDRVAREALLEGLKGVKDLERIVARACLGSAGPRDLGVLRAGLARLPKLKSVIGSANTPLLSALAARLDPMEALRTELERALVDEPPTFARDGGIFRTGYHEDLDRLQGVARGGKDWIAAFRAEEATRLGVPGLKIGYNRVFGYYIELTAAQVRSLPGGEPPPDYQRKQTIANGERYITPALKAKEEEVLHAEERLLALEQELFESLRTTVASEAAALLSNARALAEVDCLLSLAEAAWRGRYTRPVLNDEGRLEIAEGRHPVLEAIQRDPPFVANDTLMETDGARIALITGPNMAGKSTYIRQVALIVLMAHLGSFVPAARALVPLRDRLFTRVGAMDHLARGQSTFLVEMTELANILHHASGQSLVILDEVGRGTSTYDGLSIAWSVVEYLHNAPGKEALTLFATHYHELTELSATLPGVHNLHVGVEEHEGRIVFLYRILSGPTDRSYGIHAAEIAGVPVDVVVRAREILAGLEGGRAVAPRVGAPRADGRTPRARSKARMLPTPEPWEERQLSLFEQTVRNPAVERLRALDPNRLTPLDALALLAELRRLAGDG